MSLPAVPRMLLALTLGSLGGLVFRWLTLPLPWMLGALCFVMAAAVGRAPIAAPPEAARGPLVAVIGVLLGSGFTPELIPRLPGWSVSMAGLALYLALASAAAITFYARVARLDPVTAYFAGMPGGLLEMTQIGRAMGGDERRIIEAHAARIVVTVALVALWYRLVQGHAVGANPGGPPLSSLSGQDVAVLAACGLAGALLGRRLRLPAPMLLGPMLLSGAAHLTGLAHGAPPGGLVLAAQVCLGTIMGCRFIGTTPAALARALGLSLVATLLTLAVAGAVAWGVARLTGTAIDQVVLAYAPGGLTEMSLVALAVEAEVAFVAAHHVARIVMVIAAAPSVLRLWRGRGGGRGGERGGNGG